MSKRDKIVAKIADAMALWYGDRETKVTLREAIYRAVEDELAPEVVAPKIAKVKGTRYWACNMIIGYSPKNAYDNWMLMCVRRGLNGPAAVI